MADQRRPPSMYGYDASQFKNSSQLPFVCCHRHSSSSRPQYTLSPSSLIIATHHDSPALVATLHPSSLSKATPLKLIIQRYPHDVLRIIIDDALKLKQTRFIPTGVLVPDLKSIPIDPSSLTVDESAGHATLSYSTSSSSFIFCRIHFSPFSIYIDRLNESHSPTQTTVLSINTDGKLQYDTFQPQDPDSFAGYTDHHVHGAQSVGVDVNFPCATHLHGLPERTINFNLPDTVRRQTQPNHHQSIITEPYRLYNVDMPFYELDKPIGLYGCVPLLYARTSSTSTNTSSSSAVGLFWHNTSETYIDVSSSSSEEQITGKYTHWYSETGRVDVFVLPGPNMSDVLGQYLQLTGLPVMQPRFALGYHQCRYSYMSESDVRSVDAGFDQHGIPYDVMWLDIDHTDGKRYFTWNTNTFPNPTRLREELLNKGRRLVTIIDPHIKIEDPLYQLHIKASSQRLYVREKGGKKDLVEKCWPGLSSWLDYSRDDVRKVWSDQFNETNYPHFGNGFHIWNDMNEPSLFGGPERTLPKDSLHSIKKDDNDENGIEHRHIHNVYGHDMVRATYDGLSNGLSNCSMNNNNDTMRAFILTRSFFAGTQRAAAVWTGDNTADWGHLKASVRMLLTLSLCGITFCGADVGGFFGDPSPDLLVRWYQAAAFQPFFRGHSMRDTARREPWLFGEPYTSLIRTAIRTRYQFLPFWTTLFASVSFFSTNGDKNIAPPMRPLWWHFPDNDDDNDEVIQTTWLVGNALLVAPVLTKDAKTHMISLPSSSSSSSREQIYWYDLMHPEYFGIPVASSNQNYHSFEVPSLNRMFVMQRGGTIIPTAFDAQDHNKCTMSANAIAENGLAIVAALDHNQCAIGDVYVDDGETFAFRDRAQFVWSEICVADGIISAHVKAGGNARAHNFSKADGAIIGSFVVLGIRNPVTQVRVDDTLVSFTYCSKAKSLTVRDLQLSIDGRWRVTFK